MMRGKNNSKRSKVEIQDAENSIWRKTKIMEDNGVEVKRGKFLSNESDIIYSIIEKYCKELQVMKPQLYDMVRKANPLANTKIRREFYAELGSKLPNRSVRQIYYHVRRTLDPANSVRKWSPEDLERLKGLVRQHGNDWKKISGIMGRTQENCRTRYKNLKHEITTAELDVEKPGVWYPKDQRILMTLCLDSLQKFEINVQSIKSSDEIFKERRISRTILKKLLKKDSELSFNAIEHLYLKCGMTVTRGADYLRLKWTQEIKARFYSILDEDDCQEWTYDDLHKRLCAESSKPWTFKDDCKFISKMSEFFGDCRLPTDINWSKVGNNKSLRNRTPAHLRRRFEKLVKTLIRSDHPWRLSGIRYPVSLLCQDLRNQLVPANKLVIKKLYKKYVRKGRKTSFFVLESDDSDLDGEIAEYENRESTNQTDGTREFRTPPTPPSHSSAQASLTPVHAPTTAPPPISSNFVIFDSSSSSKPPLAKRTRSEEERKERKRLKKEKKRAAKNLEKLLNEEMGPY